MTAQTAPKATVLARKQAESNLQLLLEVTTTRATVLEAAPHDKGGPAKVAAKAETKRAKQKE